MNPGATPELEQVVPKTPIVPPVILDDPSSLVASLLPSPSLLISNLPTILFSQLSDVDPLVRPYGNVTQVKLLPKSTSDALCDTVSVAVEFEAVAHAQDAKEALHGQVYANSTLLVQFVQPKDQAAAMPSITVNDTQQAMFGNTVPFVPLRSHSASRAQNCPSAASSLNPFASPFVAGGCCSGSVSLPVTACHTPVPASDPHSLAKATSFASLTGPQQVSFPINKSFFNRSSALDPFLASRSSSPGSR